MKLLSTITFHPINLLICPSIEFQRMQEVGGGGGSISSCKNKFECSEEARTIVNPSRVRLVSGGRNLCMHKSKKPHQK
jgi:hypothetical protein